MLAFLFFGFASGLPVALTGETFRFWLTDAHVDLGAIGLTSLIGMSYTFKMLWAPLVDRVPLGWLTRRMGQRRSWLVFTQIVIGLLAFCMGRTDPSSQLPLSVMLAVGVAFFSATQDIAVDAYRIEYLEERQLAAGTAVHSGAWMIGAKIVGGYVALKLAVIDWGLAYAVMASFMAVGLAGVWLNKEPKRETGPEIAARQAEVDAYLAARPDLSPELGRVIGFIYVTVLSPFGDLARRMGWGLLPILLFIVFFKFQDAFAGVMSGPFVRQIGFSKDVIADVYKLWGLGATLFGLFVGGLLMNAVGLIRGLWIAAILQMASNFGFCILARVGPDPWWLAAVIGFENFCSNLGNAVFVVFVSKLCADAYTATQYALLSAVALFARTFLSAPGGYLAESVGWFEFFLLSGLSAIPGLLLLWWLVGRHREVF